MPPKSPLKSQDWLLLALYSSSTGLTPIRLQKSLFLLGEKRPDAVGAGFYRFRPYNYGPFDAQVYTDADELAVAGLVVVDSTRGQSLREYKLTTAGARLSAILAVTAPKAGLDYLKAVVAWAEQLPFHSLVRAVYQAFPSMAANSVFQDPE